MSGYHDVLTILPVNRGMLFAVKPAAAIVHIVGKYPHKLSIGKKRGKTELIMPKINNELYRDPCKQICHLLQNSSNVEGDLR